MASCSVASGTTTCLLADWSSRGPDATNSLPIADAVVRGSENTIRVEVDNTDQPNSRWYSGAGLYRPVHVVLRPATRFTGDGVRVRTLSIGVVARVEVAFTHGGGMFDLVGEPDASLRLAQAAWGTLDAPVIAVRPVDRSGQPVVKSAWRSTDAVESWAWRGCEGRTAEIEVYSTDDEIELRLNGRPIGRKRAGRRSRFLTRFNVRYEPGELGAVGYRDGRMVSSTVLRSAGRDVRLRSSSETDTVEADGLAFIHVEIVDSAGVVEMLADERIEVPVEGPATLIALGTAAPATAESYTRHCHTSYRGRALTVIRPTGQAGTIRVTASAEIAGRATFELRGSTAAVEDDQSIVTGS